MLASICKTHSHHPWPQQGRFIRLATSVRQVTRDQMDPGPTELDTGRSWFLLSSGGDISRYYRVAHGTGLIPNETQFPCRTLVACLDFIPWTIASLLFS